MIFLLNFFILTAMAEMETPSPVIRVLESVEVPAESVIYLKDVATFEGFAPEYKTQVGNIPVADNATEFAKMTSKDLMSHVRPRLKSLEQDCECKITLSLPRSLQNHTLQGDFTLDKVTEKIMQALKSQCAECEYSMEPLRISQGQVPTSYTSWELESAVKNLRGPSVVSVYFDQKAMYPLVLQTRVLVKKPVLRLVKNLSQGTVLDSSHVQAAMADMTYENKRVAQTTDIQNQELGRNLPQGQIVFIEDLREQNLVRYGQPLSVEMAHGSFHIRLSGVAQKNGRMGDRILVRVSKTKKDILAEVVGEGRVRVQR